MRKKISYICHDGAAFDDKKEACKHDLEVGIPEELAIMFQDFQVDHRGDYANLSATVAGFVIEYRQRLAGLLEEYDQADIEIYGD